MKYFTIQELCHSATAKARGLDNTPTTEVVANLTNEKWEDIKGYEGLYQVSTSGRIRSFHFKGTDKIKILKGISHRKGYLFVDLCKNGTENICSIHRLIANTFIPNPENKPCVNHKNGITSDNRIDNLEWCTHSENSLHSIFILGNKCNTSGLGKFGSEHHGSKPVEYSKNGKYIGEFSCSMEAERKLKICGRNIRSCCCGKRGTAGGYEWKFKNILK